MTELEKLTELFKTLGAPDPASWASSQVNEGINQLARFLFLREAWKLVIDEADASWIYREIQGVEQHPDAPGAGLGFALKRLLSKDVDVQDIVDVARHAQWQLLFDLCYLLNDSGELGDDVNAVSWRLFQIDENGSIIAPIDALHESVLETDPTGREMRPRPN